MPVKRRRQEMYDSVKDRIIQEANAKSVYTNPKVGETPLEEKHPGLTIGVMAAQPGTILEKALAPMVYKGMAQSISEGNLSEALMASLTPVKVSGLPQTTQSITHVKGPKQIKRIYGKVEKPRGRNNTYKPKIEIDSEDLLDNNILLDPKKSDVEPIFHELSPQKIPYKFNNEVEALTWDPNKIFGYSTKKGNIYWSNSSQIGNRLPDVMNVEGGQPGARIYNQYANAMGRRRDYRWTGLSSLYEDGQAFGIEDAAGNALLGYPFGGGIKVSHFAPNTMRGGMQQIKSLANIDQPVLFTVTDDLEPMLSKLNYKQLGSIPQFFDGDIVQKTIMLNPGARIEKIKKAISTIDDYEIPITIDIKKLEDLGFKHEPTILINKTKYRKHGGKLKRK